MAAELIEGMLKLAINSPYLTPGETLVPDLTQAREFLSQLPLSIEAHKFWFNKAIANFK